MYSVEIKLKLEEHLLLEMLVERWLKNLCLIRVIKTFQPSAFS